MNRIKVSFRVFRVPVFFAAAQDENRADGGEQERKYEQDDTDQNSAESEVFVVGLETRAVKHFAENDQQNNSYNDAEYSQPQRYFPEHLFFLRRFSIKIA